jgi:hypothetical protein
MKERAAETIPAPHSIFVVLSADLIVGSAGKSRSHNGHLAFSRAFPAWCGL